MKTVKHFAVGVGSKVRNSKAGKYGAAVALTLAALPYGVAGAQTPTGTAVDVSGYNSIFADGLASIQAAVSGPGAKAFSIMLVGLIFSVAWGLMRKGVHSLGK